MYMSADHSRTTGRHPVRNKKAAPARKRALRSDTNGSRVPIAVILESLKAYEDMLAALGFQLDRAAVREYSTEDLCYRGPMKTFFSESHAARHPSHTAPMPIHSALEGLLADLSRLLRSKLNGALPKSKRPPKHNELVAAVAKLPSDQKVALAAVVLKSQHARLVRRQEISIEEFRHLLQQYAKGQTLARKALIAHIQKEFRKRDIQMSFDTIEERFRTTTTVKTMPACIAEILRTTDDRFRTGLIPIEEMCGSQNPKEWLEERRGRYSFKSASGMHQALAEKTGLRYDSIHKALGSKAPAKRIQKNIKECFDQWEALHQGGQGLGVSEEHQGIPIGEAQSVLERLRRHFGSNGRLRDALASALDVSPSWLQRYTATSPRVKYMPMRQYARLVELSRSPLPASSRSYLRDGQTRSIAQTLCERANQALALAAEDGDGTDKALEHYKHLRLELIEVLKQRRAAPGAHAGLDAEPAP